MVKYGGKGMVTAQLFQYVDGEKKLLVQIGHNIHEVRQLVELKDSVIVEAEEKDEKEEKDESAEKDERKYACNQDR